ncbi:hypothetical protein [Pseudooceanicola onchidii]|uniref:hypothetical protein n=1 Tax=Pseudooceanicola onchidii TaxID=2562279 RepID=UPI0010A9BF15|nr:hypothetical protein [Pseudooceanicola onchidii]
MKPAMKPIAAIISLPITVLFASAALAHVEPEPVETTRPTLSPVLVQADFPRPDKDGVCRLPLVSADFQLPPQAAPQPCIQEVRAD